MSFNRVVTPEQFGARADGTSDDTQALRAAADHAFATGRRLVAQGSVYRVTETIDLRRVRLDIGGVVVGDTPDIVLLLGGVSTSGNGPPQRVYRVDRGAGQPETQPPVRIQGAKGQHIAVEFCSWVQLYADTDPSNALPSGSIAYSTFELKFATKLELATNPNTLGSTTQWINENRFLLNRTKELVVSGTYAHNHNVFEGGTFEGNASITFEVGVSNHLKHARFEAGATVTFAAGTKQNTVETSWVSSNFRFGGNVTLVDDGEFNSVLHYEDKVSSLEPIAVLDDQTLQMNGSGQYNLQGVSNVTLGAGSLSVSPWQTFYSGPEIPARPFGLIFAARPVEPLAGGFRVIVDGYDDQGALIPSTGADVNLDGGGPYGFGVGFPQTNDWQGGSMGGTFWVTNPSTHRIRIGLLAGANGWSGRGLVLSARVRSGLYHGEDENLLLVANKSNNA